MKRLTPGTAAASFTLDRNAGDPLHRQIYLRLREAIAAGTLRSGERLPSSRGLAAQLGIARGTVDAAYALLSGEGYIVARGPAGSVVSPQLTMPAAPPRHPTRRSGLAVTSAKAGALAFRMGLPALDAFPRKLWSRLASREARAVNAATLDYPDPAGYAPLREAIAAYLAVSRGIACSSGRVFVTAGYQGALDLIARVLLRPGDAVWLEDPGYFLARQALRAAGARIVPIRVDGEGLRVGDGVAQSATARFAVVTPSHQAPLGVALSLPRRLALLAWAQANDSWIIEDDYDSEYRYSGPPLPALKSLDPHDRVLYAGSFSKVLFPGLRLGYLVVPEGQVEAFSHACLLSHAGQPVHDQTVVARFMVEGHFARHLKRMRGLYAERRAALATALTREFDGRLGIELQAGGMHLMARVPTHDVALSQRASEAGLLITPLSSHVIAHDCGQGLLLSFTNIAVDAAAAAARTLRQAIHGGFDSGIGAT